MIGPNALPTLTTNPSSNDTGLELQPEPSRLVIVLKDMGRKDVSGAIFIRSLDEYRARASGTSESHPLRCVYPISHRMRRKAYSFPLTWCGRIVLLLNIVLEMIEKLDSSILGNAQHILSFIAHTLEPTPAPNVSAPSSLEASSVHGLRLDDLRIVDSDDEDESEDTDGGEADSDDEGLPEADGLPASQDLLFTALNLLLAVLEGTLLFLVPGAVECGDRGTRLIPSLAFDRQEIPISPPRTHHYYKSYSLTLNPSPITTAMSYVRPLLRLG